uniref:Uncharacterized protein n=1 Tax=viral metagenome TaxID=1070528 RepID=A0A6H1ZLB0_9ZZZZ
MKKLFATISLVILLLISIGLVEGINSFRAQERHLCEVRAITLAMAKNKARLSDLQLELEILRIAGEKFMLMYHLNSLGAVMDWWLWARQGR